MTFLFANQDCECLAILLLPRRLFILPRFQLLVRARSLRASLSFLLSSRRRHRPRARSRSLLVKPTSLVFPLTRISFIAFVSQKPPPTHHVSR